jgi:RNA polymerase sigma-70 factor (ECF subfamily)
MEEIHIIEQSRKGDMKAQTELYKRYYRGMYSVSMRILEHRADAEDAMQEAFISAFRQLDSYHGEVNFGGWLKRIVINKSIDQIRKRKNYISDLSKLSDKIEDKNEIQPIEEITPEMIKKAIGQLQDNYRIVLSLFLLEGYDHDEIADILKISNGSSRVIYHRAKEKLKGMLATMKMELKEE